MLIRRGANRHLHNGNYLSIFITCAHMNNGWSMVSSLPDNLDSTHTIVHSVD